ncbi:ACT domain-containing protein [Varibaculum prostatecancerukia]|uniref:ACT domain-containing protein n=1 Tax=Varibaculum prostatecancerukia TaxID=2811781 RepID=UPI0020404CED|nr:ACT domain-containing protein [Varibaculum prostatecancerukia]
MKVETIKVVVTQPLLPKTAQVKKPGSRNREKDGKERKLKHVKAIMTVTGIDHTGIIAAVSQALAQNQVNITNVSQTLMDEYFTMIMQLEFDETQIGLAQVQAAMAPVEEAERLVIKVQAEALFNAMHKL